MSNLIITASQATSHFLNSNLGQLAVNLAFQSVTATSSLREGIRIEELQVLRSIEGSVIPRIYGQMRLGGQLLWAGRVNEHVYESGGGKGRGTAQSRKRNYNYTLSFAIALCEGPIMRIGQVWIDGVPIDLSRMDYTLYTGTKTQEPDPIMESELGTGQVPAYRGLSYIVFNKIDLTAFGNRIPQFNFEVSGKLNAREQFCKAVNIIPGATEFGYDPHKIIQVLGRGTARHENTHISSNRSNWEVSMDDLQDNCPECEWVSLVVTWFGTDLRASHCRIEPRVESQTKNTAPEIWSVAGLNRMTANPVSEYDGRPSFGGTPNDISVKRAITDLKQRGFKILFYPFVMMDIPSGNGLDDPFGSTEQARYPWRGRITCMPGIDGTNGAETQIESFFYGIGTSTDPRWGLAHMIKHYANLCAEVGEVDAFLVGSEFVGLSRIRSARGVYPFVQHLVQLAQDVKQILPNTQLSYAADWTEYGSHFVSTLNDLYFPLDDFWADSNVDFVGIDNYAPLADWRDGADHLDRRSGYNNIHDIEYLKSNIEGGEYYEWYYENTTNRDNQTRTSITDSLNKPWVFRSKDIKNWWLNQHTQRQGGLETTNTSWGAQSKPIWFTEIGCPAVDKGPNEPNRFPDQKSSDAGLPYASNNQRDDEIQRLFLRALTEYWSESTNNPTSSLYNAPMLSADKIFIWAWDARPYPIFPLATDIWIDGYSWSRGHWINGRLSAVPLAELIREVTNDYVDLATEIRNSYLLEGYVLDKIISPRDALAPLLKAFALNPIVEDKGIVLQSKGHLLRTDITTEQHVVSRESNMYEIIREDEAELPNILKLSYISKTNEYRPALVEARRPREKNYVLTVQLPLVLRSGQAEEIAERLLAEIWTERERLKINLPPNLIALDVGDAIRLEDKSYRLTRITDTDTREIEAVRYEMNLYDRFERGDLDVDVNIVNVVPIPETIILELPALDSVYAGIPYIASFSHPWQQGVRVESSNNTWYLELLRPAILGVSISHFPKGPIGLWDKGTVLDIEIFGGNLESLVEIDVLGGGNKMAIETSEGWEVFQFCNAELIGEYRYRLTKLLRGQWGSEAVMENNLLAGAQVVFLNDAVEPLPITVDNLLETVSLSYGPITQLPNEYGWKTESIIPQKIGLKPLAPVHIKVRIDRHGHRHITWIRRSRVGGDNWNAYEIPLGEEEERYRIEIRSGTLQLRSLETLIPCMRYSASKYNLDSRYSHLEIWVMQLGTNKLQGYPAKYVL